MVFSISSYEQLISMDEDPIEFFLSKDVEWKVTASEAYTASYIWNFYQHAMIIKEENYESNSEEIFIFADETLRNLWHRVFDSSIQTEMEFVNPAADAAFMAFSVSDEVFAMFFSGNRQQIAKEIRTEIARLSANCRYESRQNRFFAEMCAAV